MAEPAPTASTTLATAGETWLLVQRYVNAYLASRETQGPSVRLSEFLPAQPAALRRTALVELIKLDLHYRWGQCGQQRPIEDYLQDFPELRGEGLPSDLICEEYHVRKRAGQRVEPDEFFKRFPQQAGQLQSLLSTDPTVTASAPTARGLTALQPGQQLDDFDLLAHLGTGAFATVFLARQRSMHRMVALKISASQGAEPQTLAQLDHPNIVRVYDQRLLPDLGLTLMYMQYVAGGTLQPVIQRIARTPPAERTGRLLFQAIDEALDRRGETPPAESALRQRLAELSWPELVCWIGARLAGALHHAHRQGVLHRDIKPANVLLTAEGMPRLADFNVGTCAKLEDASPSAFFGGSLGYMSLEQLEAFSPLHPRTIESLDGRCDLYALSVVLWELLTGRRPFADQGLEGTWNEVLAKLMAQRRAGPDQTVAPLPADIPTGMADVLAVCLTAEPNDRIATGAELAAQLDLCLKPRARNLLYPPPRGWRQLVRRYPIGSVIFIGLLANAPMAVYNFIFNDREIISWLHGAETTFYLIQGIINAVAFTTGITAFVIGSLPVRGGLRKLAAGERLTTAEKRSLMRSSLGPGLRIATIGLVCWLLAGLAYPLTLRASLDQVPVWVFAHFVASLALCGLIAGTYPFFVGTFLAVRALYPALVQPGAGDDKDLGDLDWIDNWISVYLVLASAVPLIAMTLLSLRKLGSPMLVGILGVVGLVGFAAMYFLSRVIRGDLDALREITRPTLMARRGSLF